MPVGDASPQSALCQHTVSSGRTINNRCYRTLPYLLSTHKRNGESIRLQHQPSDTTSHGTPDFPLSSDPAGHGIPTSRARKYELRLPLHLRALAIATTSACHCNCERLPDMCTRGQISWHSCLAYNTGTCIHHHHHHHSPPLHASATAMISAGSSTTGNKEW